MKTLEELKIFFSSTLYANLQVLEKERQKVLAKVIQVEGIAAVILIAVLFFCFGTFGDDRFLVHLAVLGGMAMFGLFYWLTKQYRSQFKDVVIEPLVKFLDDNLTYVKTGHVTQAIYEQSRLFTHHVERYSGDDWVEGKLGQTYVQFSELHTEYSVRSRNGRRWVTIFKGLFFVADFNKHFHGRTVVLPDSAEKMLGGFGKFLQSKNSSRDDLVKMDDPIFEKEFVVYGTDQIEARYILSSSLMKRIMDFRLKSKKNIHLSFVNSKVFVAISYSKNLFEPNVFKTLLSFSPVEEYFNDLKTAVSIVEELNLNTRIWSKE